MTSSRETPKPLIQGTHLLISLTDSEGNVVDNRSFLSDSQLANLNVEPPIVVMETLRQLAAELIAHVYPDAMNKLNEHTIRPANPSHPNENGKLN